MTTAFKKNGIISVSTVCTSDGMNCANSKGEKSFTYTPGTGTNSCMSGDVIVFDTSITGPYHVECVITWSGFDKSNTNGTFGMWFQGSAEVDGSFVWTTNSGVTSANNGTNRIESILLSATSGSQKVSATFNYTNTSITRQNFGLRSDYSNGTGTVTISKIKVVPMKYYVDGSSNGAKIGSAYVSGADFIEY